MKKLFIITMIALASSVCTWAQDNTYSMVIEMANGSKITIGPNEIRNVTFNDGQIVISGQDIQSLVENSAKQSDIARLDQQINTINAQLNEINQRINNITPGVDPTPQENGNSDLEKRMAAVEQSVIELMAFAQANKEEAMQARADALEAMKEAQEARAEAKQALDVIAQIQVSAPYDDTALHNAIESLQIALEAINAKVDELHIQSQAQDDKIYAEMTDIKACINNLNAKVAELQHIIDNNSRSDQ